MLAKCSFILFAICFLVLKSLCVTDALDKSRCDQPINIYNNLECTPTYGKHGTSCPKCYDCSRIDPRINKCYYHGKYYDIGESIENDESLPSCYVGCTCTDQLTFACAIVDCAYLEIPDGCYYTYEFNQCCPTGYKCPTNDTLVCHADGYDVYEGQTYINPNDKCSICECKDSKTSESSISSESSESNCNCRKQACDVEIYHSNSILSYCAAVYGSLTDCCPFDYICPRDDDIFETCRDSNKDLGNDKKVCKQCRYGKGYFDIGTKFSRREKYPWSETWDFYQITNCECVIPPYFTCTREYY